MEIALAVVALLTGCGVFMIGMNLLSTNLERLAGGKMKGLIGKLSTNRFAGVGTGAAVTAVVQSSAATTVMVIGFVNAGIMNLTQATSVIMGANIGTTITGVLVSLSSFDISAFLSLFALIGVALMFFKNPKLKNIGGLIAGLGLIFVGLSLMTESFKGNETLTTAVGSLFSAINFPLLLLLFGILLTALMQSSSAMTGLVIVMVGQGVLSIENALFIVLGSNIGTCLTAFIASFGANTNAKRTAIIHLLFNFIGTLIFGAIIWIFKDQIGALLNSITFINNQFKIAIFHIIFNVFTTLILLPFIKQLVKLATLIIPEKQAKEEKLYSLKYVDERLLKTPQIALMEVKNEIEYMANLSKKNLETSFKCLITLSNLKGNEINAREALIDFTNNALTKYLIKLSPLLDTDKEKEVGSYFHVINDIERIGDHAVNILDISLRMEKEGLYFSDLGKENLTRMFKKLLELYDMSLNSFDKSKKNILKTIDELENNLDNMKNELAYGHYQRLIDGKCKVELGEYFGSLISGFERIGDHLVNIAYSVINPTGSQNIK